MAKFQGTWKLVSMEVEDGKKPDAEINKYTVVLKGDSWSVSAGDKIVAPLTFKGVKESRIAVPSRISPAGRRY